jgi:hypothetical protein
MAEPITHEHLSNQDLLLHIYGDWEHIRATQFTGPLVGM